MCMVSKLVAGILFEDIPMTLFQWVFRCSKTAGGFLKWECPYIIYFHGIFHYTSTILGCHHDYGSPHFFNWCLDWPAGPQWQWQESFFSHAQLGWFWFTKFRQNRGCAAVQAVLSPGLHFSPRAKGARALRTLAFVQPSERWAWGESRGGEWWELPDSDAMFTSSYLLYSFHLCEWRSRNNGQIWNWSSIPTNSTRCFAQKGLLSFLEVWDVFPRLPFVCSNDPNVFLSLEFKLLAECLFRNPGTGTPRSFQHLTWPSKTGGKGKPIFHSNLWVTGN